MWFLKVFLYLICVFCVSWSVLFFGGPVIVKWFVLSYSDQKLVPSNIRISPKFDINIGRVDFVIDDAPVVGRASGFSRSVRVSWSLLDTKPFLTLQAGPTFLENVFVSDTLSLRTLPFSAINFEQLVFELEATDLSADHFGSVKKIKVLGTLKKNLGKLANLSSEFTSVSSKEPNLWGLNTVTAEVDEIDLKLSLYNQSLAGTLSADQLSSTRYGLDTAAVKSNFVLKDSSLEFESNIENLGLYNPDGEIDKVYIDGDYDFENFLWKAQLDLAGGFFGGGSFEFSSLTTNLSKLNSENYEALIEADVKDFEISSQNQYLATIPPSNVKGKFYLDRANVRVRAESELRVKDPDYTEITGQLQMLTKFDQWVALLDCLHKPCRPSELLLEYKLNLDEEIMSGQSLCLERPCMLSEMGYVIETSHTGKVFQKLSTEKIFNPIILATLYSVVISGEVKGPGHKIKFN